MDKIVRTDKKKAKRRKTERKHPLPKGEDLGKSKAGKDRVSGF